MATLTEPLIAPETWEARFTVLGEPVPWGVGRNPKTGDRFVPNRQARARGNVMDAYVRQVPARGLLTKDESVRVTYRFYTARPAYHYGTGRNAGIVKDRYLNARPTGRPDLDNCCKLVTDALTGVCWADDDQIVSLTASKEYTEDAPRIEVEIRS